jgi:hypothetical protein
MGSQFPQRGQELLSLSLSDRTNLSRWYNLFYDTKNTLKHTAMVTVAYCIIYLMDTYITQWPRCTIYTRHRLPQSYTHTTKNVISSSYFRILHSAVCTVGVLELLNVKKTYQKMSSNKQCNNINLTKLKDFMATAILKSSLATSDLNSGQSPN